MSFRWWNLLLLALCAACSSAGESGGDPGPRTDAGTTSDAGYPDASSGSLALSIRASSSNPQVGQAVVFEGVSAPALDTRGLSWDFGDGVRGGGANIAHAFAKTGDFSVTLSALDSEGRLVTARAQIRVSSAVVPGPNVGAKVRIQDVRGRPVVDAALSVDATAAGSSDDTGELVLTLTSDTPHVLRVTKAGYAEQVRKLTLMSASREGENDISITLLARAAPQKLDASAGGTVVGADGASLTLAKDSVIDSRGKTVSGSINVSLTSVDVTDDEGVRGFPGEFAGLQANGQATGIVSHGTTEFVLEKDGERLNLAPGARAEIRIAVFAGANLDGTELEVGSSMPLWSLDERLGTWVQEGTGTVVDLGEGELALEATVAHFSWWNADMPFTPARPKPKCVLLGSDVPGANDYLANASICKMLIDIDRGIPEQKAAKNRKLPAYSALDDVPINGGKGVYVPAEVGITLRGCILSGLFCGETSLNLSANASEQVEIRLLPTDDGVMPPVGDGTLISAPYDQDFPFDQATKSDVYRYRAEQGSVTQVMLSRSAALGGSKLNTGTLRLFRGNELIAVSAFDGQGNAGEVPGQVTIVAPTAGEYTLEVAWSEQPVFGQYRLRLVPLTVAARDLPFDAETVPAESEGWLAYAFDAPAQRPVRVFGWFSLYSQAAATPSSIKLLRSDGRPLATNPPADADNQYHFDATPPVAERLLLVAYYQNAPPPWSRVNLSVNAPQPLLPSPAPVTKDSIPTYASRSYRFMGTQAQAVTLTLTRGYGYSQMDLRLYDASGQRLAAPTVSGTATYVIETTLPSSAEYWVEVIRGQPITGDTGAYTLSLAD